MSFRSFYKILLTSLFNENCLRKLKIMSFRSYFYIYAFNIILFLKELLWLIIIFI
jgi:hypothetical protein